MTRYNLTERQNEYNKHSRSDNSEISNLSGFKERLKKTGFSIEEPEMSEQQMIMTINLLKYFDEQETKDIVESVEYKRYLAEKNRDSDDEENQNDVNYNSNKKKSTSKRPLRLIDGLPEIRQSVLIFVPGMNEILQLKELIEKELKERRMYVLPLHSDIVIEQQRRVFDRAQPSYRKVIIATGIAESSITVPGKNYL